MWKHQFAKWSAVSNLLGTFLLFFSFQATSTDFLLVITKDNRSALCVGSNAMFVMTPTGGLGIGTRCPDPKSGKPTAIVNTDQPVLATLGLSCIILGFFMQLFSIEKPSARAIKRLQKTIRPN